MLPVIEPVLIKLVIVPVVWLTIPFPPSPVVVTVEDIVPLFSNVAKVPEFPIAFPTVTEPVPVTLLVIVPLLVIVVF